MDYLQSQVLSESIAKEFLVADFASGENDKIPSFIHRVLPNYLSQKPARRIVTYSTDLHGLRLDSLYGMFEEQDLTKQARAVFARLESMVSEASFRQEQADYLISHEEEQTGLDKGILEGNGIGEDTFDLGFLNNDVVGYLFEYYKAYTDALASLLSVHRTIRLGGYLVVTQPCSLYRVNNLQVLEEVGFSFIEGIDIETKTGAQTHLDDSMDFRKLSRLGHYTYLVFKKD